ncbi:lysophospholipid acyltransferase family protein [Candidatus Palauibacter sp.]|uniref:lysophospholipid acyltransferase family protein n=1 Tax=Candidatus Palauibacter sp. TaxID=3101350 RepID=UPI003B5BBE44
MRRLAKGVLRLVGWRAVGELPGPRSVVIGAPHTSNWDFPLALLCFWSLPIPARWVGKHTIFRWPFGGLLRRLGGIPLDRAHTHDFVNQIVERFDREPELTFVLAPEGTRSRRDHWRSGFYWIARRARVPVALGFVDYSNREVGIGDAFLPSGDVDADMARVRAFYADKTGKRPEKQSVIRIRVLPPSPPGGA